MFLLNDALNFHAHDIACMKIRLVVETTWW